MRMVPLALPLCLCAASAAAQAPSVYERGRTYARWVQRGEVDSLVAVLAPASLAALGGRDRLVQGFEQLAARAGTETAVIEEAAFREMAYTTYVRLSAFERAPSITTSFSWDEADMVVAVQVRPTPTPAPTEHLERDTLTPLRLPFDGWWQVIWGGREPHLNYHVVAPDQRFAYDFVPVRDGRMYEGDEKRNESYFCFGAPIHAPGAGTVVEAVDSIADNAAVGTMNEAAPPGNFVVIDHGNGEFSFLAHMRRGSLAVAPGQPVEAGELIGRCGNSGRSSLPHLHYHLQTGAGYRDGVGLPALFTDYFVGGRYVPRGEPVRGQIIRPAPRVTPGG